MTASSPATPLRPSSAPKRLCRTSLALGGPLLALLVGALAPGLGARDAAPRGALAGQDAARQVTPGAGVPAADPKAEPRALGTVILVRHAEKGDDDPRDPHLTEVGRRRAEALSDLLAGAGVTHLFASEFRRTQETLASLAARAGVAVAPRPARDVEGLVAALRALPPDAVAVVAGHSNTIPAVARALGVEPPGLVDSASGRVLDEAVYDRVWVVTHGPGARTELLDLRLAVR